MRLPTLILALVLGLAPAFACINDGSLQREEKEFRDSYEEQDEAEAPPTAIATAIHTTPAVDLNLILWVLAGTVAVGVIGIAIAVPLWRNGNGNGSARRSRIVHHHLRGTHSAPKAGPDEPFAPPRR